MQQRQTASPRQTPLARLLAGGAHVAAYAALFYTISSGQENRGTQAIKGLMVGAALAALQDRITPELSGLPLLKLLQASVSGFLAGSFVVPHIAPDSDLQKRFLSTLGCVAASVASAAIVECVDRATAPAARP